MSQAEEKPEVNLCNSTPSLTLFAEVTLNLYITFYIPVTSVRLGEGLCDGDAETLAVGYGYDLLHRGLWLPCLYCYHDLGRYGKCHWGLGSWRLSAIVDHVYLNNEPLPTLWDMETHGLILNGDPRKNTSRSKNVFTTSVGGCVVLCCAVLCLTFSPYLFAPMISCLRGNFLG